MTNLHHSLKPISNLLAALAFAFTCVAPTLNAAERPNIIFLLADDLAANAVGYSGNNDVITPNIDKLAREGVRFMNHYDTTSICMASRCTILTGLYEYRHGVSGKPFCMSISFKAPHMPFTPDPIDFKLYEGKTFTRPPNYGVDKGTHLSPQVHTSRAAKGYREWVTDFDETSANYYALVTGVDVAVGMIRDELARQELDRNTVIIFTSDNGFNRGAHGFGDKVLPYEEGSKAPLIIYDPRLPAERNGKSCEAVTGNIDMAATMFALAGVPAPTDIDGKSLLPLLANPIDKVHEYLPLFNFWGAASAQSMAIVTPEWKYIHWYYGEEMTTTEELFHIGNDRFEMSNSANEASSIGTLAIMRQHYDKQLADISNRLAHEHAYDHYPTLFSRTIPWPQKAELVKRVKATDSEGEAATNSWKTPGAKAKNRAKTQN